MKPIHLRPGNLAFGNGWLDATSLWRRLDYHWQGEIVSPEIRRTAEAREEYDGNRTG